MSDIRDRQAEIHRIAYPEQVAADGTVNARAFVPRPKDKGLLSVLNRGSAAHAALAEFRTAFPKSHCKHALTVVAGQVIDLNVPIREDPSANLPSHAVADFTTLSLDEVELAAEDLAANCSVFLGYV